MESELISIFIATLDAHFPIYSTISRIRYVRRFKEILAEEMPDAPRLEVKRGNLATYLKLSVMVLAMVRLYKEIDLRDEEIGESIYHTAEKVYRLSPVKKWLRKQLFFSMLNRMQIRRRQREMDGRENGINGFKVQFVRGKNPGEFGVDYVKCGICEYYSRKGMSEYVKYLCLVDYVIMKNMGVVFSRTTTLGNGGKKCDFRFSKKGKIKDGWPPEGLREFVPNRNEMNNA